MTDEMTEPRPGALRRLVDALPDMIASAGTGAIDWAATGTPSAGATAPLFGLLIQVGADALSNRQRRGSRALETAAERLGGSDRLAEAATSDEARLELTARVIEAAMHTTREDKIRALGRVLADGLRDGDVDEARLLAAALALIEGPHVAVLAHLNAHPVPPAELIRAGVESSSGWRADLLAQQLPTVAGVVEAVLAVLAGQGLILDVRGRTYADLDGRSVWQIAPLGRRCLFLLTDVINE